ncbi:MAG: hypothetical protein WC477_01890 [Patescibacteria group bacterium]
MKYTIIVIGAAVIFISAFAITNTVQAFATAIGKSQERAMSIGTDTIAQH